MLTWHCQGIRVAMPTFLIPTQKRLFTMHLLFLSFCAWPVNLPMHFYLSNKAELTVCVFRLPIGSPRSPLFHALHFSIFHCGFWFLSPLDLLSTVSTVSRFPFSAVSFRLWLLNSLPFGFALHGFHYFTLSIFHCDFLIVALEFSPVWICSHVTTHRRCTSFLILFRYLSWAYRFLYEAFRFFVGGLL